MSRRASAPIHGVDFTSSPRPGKPITVATGVVAAERFEFCDIAELADWVAFEHWLARPGPWIGGFDFPFGLPRSAVRDLHWPLEWPALVRFCAAMGREAFRAALDGYRAGRPAGDKYPYRRGDAAAGSHSPIKLVNPPVALMFLEGAPRLLAAGIELPGIAAGDRTRVALEAYPGHAARWLTGSRVRVSYKNDARAKQTPAHRARRVAMLRTLARAGSPFGLRLVASAALLRSLAEDGTGDRLDALLCAMQAAWAWQRRARGWGLPGAIDPLEGWIATVPG